MLKLLILLLPIVMFAKSYYARVLPFETYKIASAVSGEVAYVDRSQEGKRLSDKSYIVIDDALNQKELYSVQSKLKSLNELLRLNSELLHNNEEIVKRKEKNYEQVKSLKVKSAVEKDREYYDLLASKNQLISIEQAVNNLKTQIADLSFRESSLLKSISDKHVSATGKVLYATYVTQGQYVAPGTLLAEVADVSKAKVTLYVLKADREHIEDKRILINGKEGVATIYNIYSIADAKHLSSYKVELVLPAPKFFSEMVKIEFKNDDTDRKE